MQKNLLVLILLGLIIAGGRLAASPLDPNNILVSNGQTYGGPASSNSVLEYTPSGSFVQAIGFTYGNHAFYRNEYLRGIAVDPYGAIAGYNGTFYPFLSRVFPDTGVAAHATFPGWSVEGGTGWNRSF
jgi:hypothetical protein